MYRASDASTVALVCDLKFEKIGLHVAFELS